MKNRNFIAETILGDCSLCCLRLDVGEWVSQRTNGRLIHLGCVPKATTADSAPTLFSLISDNELETAIETASAAVEQAKEAIGTKHISFDGATVLGIDTPRLAAQMTKVLNLMRDSRFRTLSEIAAVAGCLETSASARLRDFRKTRFGAHTVVHRQRANSQTYEYQLIVRETGSGRRNAA